MPTGARRAGPSTVLVVEDDPGTRARLAQAIAGHPDLALVGACATFDEGRRALEAAPPAVLLTDLDLPGGNGIDLIRQVRASGADTQSMVVTVFEDENVVVRALEAGADGYLLKDDSIESVAEAVLLLVGGGSPISARIARFLLHRFRAAADAAPDAGPSAPAGGVPRARLTDRETEILQLIGRGFTFGEIGGLLGISPHTVTAHVRHIYDKLEVNSRGEAVFEAANQGLLKIGE